MEQNNLREYEAIYILPGALDKAAIDSNLEKHKKFIEERGGKVDKAELWDKRKLAYNIKGHQEGNYCLIQFSAPPSIPSELSRIFRISDEVIRARIFLREW